ncbi:carboxypeptidase B-like [Portunus trituberculatus]|nr:carboxypeptidase B-like [Portunus trituberculatus]
MARWAATHAPLSVLAVMATLFGASLCSPLHHPCYSEDPDVPCDSFSASNTHADDDSSPPFPAVKREGNGDIQQPGHEAVSYTGYKLLRANVEDSKLPVVDSLDTAEGVDLWSWRRKGRSHMFEVDLLTPPAAEPKVKQLFSANNLPYQEVIKDLQDAINKQKDDFFFSWNRPAHPMTWEKYHSFDEMEQYLYFLEAEYPHLVTLEEIGYSSENRSLKVAKVSTGPNRTAIWIDGGMHAREWIAPATTMYILYRLVENAWEFPELVNNFDWYILPIANPDGYEFSRTKDRLWRKTRSINPAFPDCVGVDPNRNFGYKWATKGSSNYPCSSIYHGPEPFSEPETKAMADFLLTHKDELKVYVTIHAYSQMWMAPWSSSHTLAANNKDLIEVGQKAVEAIKSYNATEYALGTVPDLLYLASGSSMDFAHGTAGIPYSYALELRDRGNYGFILPKEQIHPTAQETFLGIRAMTEAIFHKLYPGKKFV